MLFRNIGTVAWSYCSSASPSGGVVVSSRLFYFPQQIRFSRHGMPTLPTRPFIVVELILNPHRDLELLLVVIDGRSNVGIIWIRFEICKK